MSYAFTAYFNDAGIDTTQIYHSYNSYTRHYGDPALTVSGFSGNMRFTATPASGYAFYRWVYRVGSITGAVQYSYANPFNYTGEEDIFIRAESEATTLYTTTAGIRSDAASQAGVNRVNWSPHSVAPGGSCLFIAVANAGYRISGWYTAASGGARLTTGGSYTKTNITSDITLYAGAVKTYAVEITTTTGIASASGAGDYAPGDTVTLTATPASGYAVSRWRIYGPTTRWIDGDTCTFTMPAYDVEVTVYAAQAFTCTAYRTGYTGMVSAVSASPSEVVSGETCSFSATLVSGYYFDGWYTAASGGTKVSSANPYVATITADTALYARASSNPQTFSWTYPKSTGSSAISAEEWERLKSFVNGKRSTAYDFYYTAVRGQPLTRNMYNEMVAAIGAGATVARGQGISAALLNALVTAANAM